MRIPTLIGLVVAIVLVVLIVFGHVTTLEAAVEACESSGGNVTSHGDLLYCDYHNGTGRPLGTDRPLSEVPDGGG